eukprot:Protomagalhaensia_wolfi_Nauph_80__5203@NODE_558_length_2292_cov_177_281846_g416_i0_p2_GENE_NODE_558_length_2292_cov_177_281846_g416_i0NODE_558_length_2292_cov_177_281846_g416_i0_p2_ORF_typecomplete_len318_score28_85_NODE_558_length_2292_cov_177_281846_g416_i011172070
MTNFVSCCVERLLATNSIEESRFIVRILAIRKSERGRDEGRVLELLLTYLKKIIAPGLKDPYHCALIIETASFIAGFNGWVAPHIEPFPLSLYSSLLVETDDPIVLRSLCRLLRVHVQLSGLKTIEITMNAKASEGRTVLDRLFQLLVHPFWPLRIVVIRIFHGMMIRDKCGQFSVIGERLGGLSRDLLNMPRSELSDPGTQMTLITFLAAAIRQYTAFVEPSLNSGLIEDLILILEADCDLLEYETQQHQVAIFLYFLIQHCTIDQMQQLETMGCFDVIRRHDCGRPYCRWHTHFSVALILIARYENGSAKKRRLC